MRREEPAVAVAVVIPTMNRPGYLARCVESVLRGKRLPAELIVCDQSGDGATRAALEELMASERPGGGTTVRYIRMRRANASMSRNAGMRAASSRLVAFIDDDCEASEGWLRALVEAHTDASGRGCEPAAVTGRVLPAKGAGVPVSSRSSGARRVFRAGEGDAWAPWDAGTGGNMLVRRDALVRIRGFNPRLGPGSEARAAEDIDLIYRLAPLGPIVYEPEAIVYHPPSSRCNRLRSRYTYGKGMTSMLAAHITMGEPEARRLLSLYVRHQATLGLKRPAWGILELALTLVGGLAGVAGGRRVARWYSAARGGSAQSNKE